MSFFFQFLLIRVVRVYSETLRVVLVQYGCELSSLPLPALSRNSQAHACAHACMQGMLKQTRDIRVRARPLRLPQHICTDTRTLALVETCEECLGTCTCTCDIQLRNVYVRASARTQRQARATLCTNAHGRTCTPTHTRARTHR